MQIESRKKKLCLEPLRGIITQGEKLADAVTFRLPNVYGDLTLSTLSWQLRAASEKNTLATADLTASASGEFCLVQWEVSADFTAVSGALSLMLVGTDSEGNVVIKFPGDDPIWVRDAETGQYSPPEDAIQKALNGLQQAESALEDATKALQEIGINFKILGHYGTLPELEVAVTSPSLGDAYGVGDPTVVYVWNGSAWVQLPGVLVSPSLPMSVANGGTGATTSNDALKNLGAQASNNLLVNPRFKYNSRSQQSYTGSGWTVDGWYGYNITQAGNVLTAQQTGANISQPIKCDLNLLYGKSIAFSIATSGAAVVFGTATMPQSFSSTVTVGSASTQWGNIAVYWDSSVSKLKFGINLNQGQSITITAAKLELGSVSTLQAELDNPPPEDVEKLKLDMYDLDPGRCAYLPWHNENLLDNWYFVGGGSRQGGGQFPINQRGETSWNTVGYHLDRWKQESSGNGSISPNGYTVPPTHGMATAQFVEKSFFENLAGKIITVSALDNNGEYRSASVRIPNNISQSWVDGTHFKDGTFIGMAFYSEENVYQGFRITVPDSVSKTFVAVKAELGTRSTLARKDESGNWVLNDPPPNFQQELAKCQRYLCVLNGFGWIGSGQIDASGITGQFFIPTPVSMRPIIPTISGNIKIYNAKNILQATGVTASGKSGNGVNGAFNLTSWDSSGGGSVAIYLDGSEDKQLIISAEL